MYDSALLNGHDHVPQVGYHLQRGWLWNGGLTPLYFTCKSAVMAEPFRLPPLETAVYTREN